MTPVTRHAPGSAALLCTAVCYGALAAAFRGVAFRHVGQRLVGIEFRGVVAERDRQRRDGVGVIADSRSHATPGKNRLSVSARSSTGRRSVELFV